MKPAVRAAALAVPAILCVAAWLPRRPGDPVEPLARALVTYDAERIASALDRLVPGRWSVSESAEHGAGVRRFRLDGTHPAARGAGALSGFASVSAEAGWALAWLTLEPGAGDGAAPERHDEAGWLAASLFEIRANAGGSPLYPSVPEFLRRLRGDGAAHAPARWELATGARLPIVVATSPSGGPLFSDGFTMIALQPSDPAQEGEAKRFAGALAAALGRGAVLPTPRPAPGSTAAPFRSERGLVTGDVPLAEAVATAAGAFPAEGIAVSGLRARVRTLLDGPEAGQVTAVIEAVPEGTTFRAVLPGGGREEELLARLAPGAGGAPRGDLVWSGRILKRVDVPYVGAAWELADLAFEWRPDGT